MDSMAALTLLIASLCVACVTSWQARDMPPTFQRQHGREYRQYQHRRSENDCPDKPADLVFVMDGSSSIWNPDFETQLQFVSDVVDSFRVGQNNMHFGALTFATDVDIQMTLTQYGNKAAIKTALESIVQPRGETNTDEALRIMRETLFDSRYARPGIPHIGIVITDGASSYPERTERQAQLVKDMGITMFAIGVGRNLEEDGILEELHKIASGPEYVYTAQTYDLLDRLKDDLSDKACKATTPAPTTTTTTTTTTTAPPPQMIEGCDLSEPLDVLFSLPDEAGVGDTELALTFVGEVVDGFKIGPKQVQAGLTPRMCSDLEGISLNQHDEKTSLLEAMGSRRLSATQLSLQLKYMLRQGFTAEDGARTNSRRVAIMVVDNVAADSEKTQLLAADAKAEGITIFTIGIGPYANKRELKRMATSPKYAFFVADYSALMTLPQKIWDTACEELSRN